MRQKDLRVVVRSRLGPWAPDWDRLAAAAPVPSPFARSWWVDAVDGPGRAVALVVEDDHRLLGGVTFRVEQGRMLPHVSIPGDPTGPEHADIVAARHREADVTATLRGWFRRRPAHIQIRGMTANSLLRHLFASQTEPEIEDVAHFVTLESTLDAQLARRGSKRARELRRKVRRLEDAGIRHEIVQPERHLEVLETLKTFQAAEHDDDAFLVQFEDTVHTALLADAAADEVVVHRLADGDGTTLMVDVGLVVAGRYSAFQIGRKPDAPSGIGEPMMVHTLDLAISRGCRELDLLRGRHDYKRSWATGTRSLYALDVPVGITAHAVSGARAANQRVRARVRR